MVLTCAWGLPILWVKRWIVQCKAVIGELSVKEMKTINKKCLNM